jgi:hypothetical protein
MAVKMEGGKVLTQWHIIVWFHGHILLDLDVIDCLENGQAMSNTGNAHFLELCVLQSRQHVA